MPDEEQMGLLDKDYFVACGDCLKARHTKAHPTELVAPPLPSEVLVDIGTDALELQGGRCFRCGHTLEGDGHVVEVVRG